MQEPVCLSDIPRIRASDAHTVTTPYNPDVRGMLHIEYRPSCADKLFMCPFPFLFLGCCLSQSTDLDFDDYKKTLRIASCPGYFFCCSNSVDILYSDIANVAAVPCPGTRINHQPAYKFCIITRAGAVHELTGASLLSTIKEEILSLHRYMFGRLNKEYRPPSDFIFTL